MKSIFAGFIIVLLLASCHHTDPVEALSVNLQTFDTSAEGYFGSPGGTYSLSKQELNKGNYVISVVAGMGADTAYMLIDTSFITLTSTGPTQVSEAKHEYIEHYANKYYDLTLDLIKTGGIDEVFFFEGLMTLKAKNSKQVTKHIFGSEGD
jgi:hypothetical protein